MAFKAGAIVAEMKLDASGFAAGVRSVGAQAKQMQGEFQASADGIQKDAAKSAAGVAKITKGEGGTFGVGFQRIHTCMYV